MFTAGPLLVVRVDGWLLLVVVVDGWLVVDHRWSFVSWMLVVGMVGWSLGVGQWLVVGFG